MTTVSTQTQSPTNPLSSSPLLHAALIGTPLLVLLLPDTALAGSGGTEFQATYDMLIGWMTGLLGRIIAVAFIIVGLIAGVARQSIMSFAIGISAGLGLFMAPDIVDAVVSATLPIV